MGDNQVTTTLRDIRNRRDFNRRKQLFDQAIKNLPGRAVLTDLEGLVLMLQDMGDVEGEQSVTRALSVLGMLRAAVRGGPIDTPAPARERGTHYENRC